MGSPILHCGCCAGSPERKQSKACFLRVPPDGANFQSVITQIRTVKDFCVGWIHTRVRVPTKIRNADGGNAGEQIRGVRMDFMLRE